MMRLKLVIAYDGSNYAGWQIQEKPSPPRTIQGAVETALFSVTGHKIRVCGSGRTDAGVHAWGQIAHCDLPCGWEEKDWRHTLNALLPADIRIIEAVQAPAGFHARKSAIAKTYIYQLWQDREFVPPFLANYVWPCGRLNIDEMKACIPFLLGSHDFASFQNVGTPVNSTVREIISCELVQGVPMQWLSGPSPLVCLQIKASGFLKQMMRNIAGFMVWTGLGKLACNDIDYILSSRSRRVLPSPTAPAKGLFLAHAHYEPSPPTTNAFG